MSATLTARDFETVDGDKTWPFYEDENGQVVTGYGHIDKAEFARLVNEYDQWIINGVLQAPYTPEHVHHGHAEIEFNDDLGVAQGFPEWGYRNVPEPTGGSIPITWIAR